MDITAPLKDKQFHMRVTADELSHWRYAATELGYESLSDMAREVIAKRASAVPTVTYDVLAKV